MLNKKIAKIIRDLGLIIYLPQEVIPPGTNASPKQIFEANLVAVKDSDIIVSVLDKPGLGVSFELAYALALNKTIVAFRSDKQEYLGKILEGLWESLNEKHKASSLKELKYALEALLPRGID